MALTKRTDAETNELKGVVLAVDQSKIKFGTFIRLSNWKPSGVNSIKKKRGVKSLVSTTELPIAPAVDCTQGATVVAPNAPSALSAVASSDDLSIVLTWTDNSADESRFEILRAEGTGSTNLTPVGSVEPNATTFTDSGGLDPLTTYVYAVRAYNQGGVSANSNTDEATTIDAPASPPILNMVLWLDGDALLYNDGDPVDLFDDQSSESNDFTGAATPTDTRPIFVADGINGLGSVRFDGLTQFLSNLSLDTSAYTEASIFVVGQLVADPPFADVDLTGIYKFNPSNGATQFPALDGIIREGVWTTAKKTATSATAGALATPFQYNVISEAGVYKIRLNRTEIFTTGVNVFQGQATENFLGKSGTSLYQGLIAEVCIFQEALNSSDRNLVETYLELKWNL